MLLNLGPTQTAFDPQTGAEYNIDFKLTDPIRENPGGYIIPGFYPQGDLISVFTTVAAPLLGAASGYGSRDLAEAKAEEAYKRIVEGEGNFKNAIAQAQQYENEMLAKKKERESTLTESKSTLTESDLNGLYGDTFIFNKDVYFSKSKKDSGSKKRINKGETNVKERSYIKDFSSYAEKILKGYHMKTGKDGEIILTTGPSLFLRGNAESDSKKTYRRNKKSV
jgi:hypothetical protein